MPVLFGGKEVRVILWVMVVAAAVAVGWAENERARAVRRARDAEEWAQAVEDEAVEWMDRARGR